jgi:hypothetical protein
MQLHTMPLPDDPEMVAALFGPVVLAGVLEPASRDAYVDGDAAMIKAFRKSVKPVYFIGRPDAPSEWITPVSGQPLAFEGNGPNEKVSMIPFDRIGAERYGLYWPVVAKDGARQKALAGQSARWEREIDRVFTFPGDAKSSPSEGEHALKGEKMLAGTVPGTAHCFRHAEPGGWFSWDLKSIPDQPIDLAVTYWGADVNRTFDILVDDQIVATETLKGEHPGVLFETVYPVPPEVTKGKEKVTVTFRASHDTLAGGTYGCATLRR